MDKQQKMFSDEGAFTWGIVRSFWIYIPKVSILGDVKDTMDRDLEDNPRYSKGKKCGYAAQAFFATVLASNYL